MYAPDGELLEVGMAPLEGPAAIAAFLASFTGVAVDSSAMSSDAVDVYGTAAMQWGTFAQVARVEGHGIVRSQGRFVAQWVKQHDGRWLIHRLMPQPAEN
jgi:ketosteroid isomerase-like protein